MTKAAEEALTPQAQRLFRLVALIAESPGIDQERLKESLEADTGRSWGTSTLFKDIRLLKELGVLADGAHRSGYFLMGSSFPDDEIKLILNALRVQGVNLRSAGARELYERLLKRFARNRADVDILAYPVEAVANRVSVQTLDDDFRELVEVLRAAIRTGQEVVIRKLRDPWKVGVGIDFRIYPLQFIFHDMAWYLLAEDAEEAWFKLFRLDRLSPAVEVTATIPRGIRTQQQVLHQAKALLHQGWGMTLPTPPSKPCQEIALVPVEVRFDAYAANFIRESPRLHPTQELQELPQGELLFRVRLPESALTQFQRWLASWGEHGIVRSPEMLRERLIRLHRAALARYVD